MNFDQINRTILFCVIIALIFSIFPLLVYYYNFKEASLSKDLSDWGNFGSYLSGTSGTLLSFFAVIFSLISLYFTLRIAKQLHDDETRFNKEQTLLTLQLQQRQNIPYPYLNLSKHDHITIIEIQNMGLGPLVINNWKVVYQKTQNFNNFLELLESKCAKGENEIDIRYNSASEHVIAPNSSKELLVLVPSEKIADNTTKRKKQNQMRKILSECEIEFDYQDIFSNKGTYRRSLDFLTP